MPAPVVGADDSAEVRASSLRLLTRSGAGRAVSGWCSAMQECSLISSTSSGDPLVTNLPLDV